VLTATLYERTDDGELVWQNQAMLRGVYRAGLASPDSVPVGEPVTYNLTFYPQDDVLDPANDWVVALGEDPRFGVPRPDQLDSVDYDLDSVTIELPQAPTDTQLDAQPEPVPCFAC